MNWLDTLPFESIDLEAKRAAGRDGRGELPKSIWETYSAFANTEGGLILLGVSEDDKGKLFPTGVIDTDKVIDNFWKTVNNPDHVNANILSNEQVEVVIEGELNIIQITVPRATRKQRPIYLGKKPLIGTYVRKHTGDYKCSEVDVRRMLAEQIQDSRDMAVLQGFDIDDIDESTLKAYRNRLAVVRPDHARWSQ